MGSCATSICNLIPQLVDDHFGVDAPRATIFTQTVSQELKSKLTTVVMTILQNDRFGVFSQQVAFRQLLEFLNIPFTTGPSNMPEPLIPKPQEEEDGKEEPQPDEED